MEYEVYFAAACSTGKVRKINQDNFWCGKKYLKAKNKGLKTNIYGKTSSKKWPAFAVFDGMGGEQDGEVAAYIAASAFDKLYAGSKEKTKHFLAESCKKINSRIIDYTRRQHLECVGTTAAMLMFGEDRIYLCSIGDSRIYRYKNNDLAQLSKDDTDNKKALTQFLGIPESGYRIKPRKNQKYYNNGDLYLICSDGLTGMLSEEEIKNILSENADVKTCADVLKKSALEKGGMDNITIILCKTISKMSR